jgi:3-oxoacyl-[acyl-carrier protein] reductase
MARTVVISGGGTGIGLAAAETFAADRDRVVLIGRRAGVLERAAARLPGALACPGDLTDPGDAARVAALIEREYGTVDVLVHSAGGDGRLEPPPAATERAGDPAGASGSASRGPSGGVPGSASGGTDSSGGPADLAAVARQWALNFRLNTLTAVLLTEALRDHLATPGGRVLFLSSIAACRGSALPPYAAAKAALHPYAFRLARELGPRGVTVNVVAPGLVEETGFFGGPLPQDRRRELVAETLTGRLGHPGDVAQTLHWLASSAAGHITAQVVQVNGGAERGH